MASPYYQDEYVTIYNKDSRDMSEVPNESVGLLVTSPPYFNEREYSQYSDIEEYENLIRSIVRSAYTKLRWYGFIVWNISMVPKYDLTAFTSIILSEANFNFQKKIIWRKFGSVTRSLGLVIQHPYVGFYIPESSYEDLLVFTKGNMDGIRKNQTQIDLVLAQKFSADVWDISQVHTGTQQDFRHTAPFPEQLVANSISFYCEKDTIMLDPFLGSGTTCFVAKKLGRKSIGYDTKEEYCEISANRCRQYIAEFSATSQNSTTQVKSNIQQAKML